MSIEMWTMFSKVPNNQVIIMEQNKNNQSPQPDKFYLVKEDFADKFIQAKKGNEIANKWQKGLSIMTAASIAYLTSINTKSSNIFIKAATGFLSAVGSLVGLQILDIKLDKWRNQTAMKNFHAKEISKEEAKNLVNSQKTQKEEIQK